MDRIFTRISTAISGAAGQPVTFILALGAIVLWAVTGPIFQWSDTWQLIVNTATTVITFLMVFLIQNSQNRDAAAMQAKLDEILRAIEPAREQFIGIEHLTDNEIETIRSNLEKEVGREDVKSEAVHLSVRRLLMRR